MGKKRQKETPPETPDIPQLSLPDKERAARMTVSRQADIVMRRLDEIYQAKFDFADIPISAEERVALEAAAAHAREQCRRILDLKNALDTAKAKELEREKDAQQRGDTTSPGNENDEVPERANALRHALESLDIDALQQGYQIVIGLRGTYRKEWEDLLISGKRNPISRQ